MGKVSICAEAGGGARAGARLAAADVAIEPEPLPHIGGDDLGACLAEGHGHEGADLADSAETRGGIVSTCCVPISDTPSEQRRSMPARRRRRTLLR